MRRKVAKNNGPALGRKIFGLTIGYIVLPFLTCTGLFLVIDIAQAYFPSLSVSYPSLQVIGPNIFIA